MKHDVRNSEELLLNIVAALVLIGFLVLWGGLMVGSPKAVVISTSLLIISATQITTFLFLIKVYERISKARS